MWESDNARLAILELLSRGAPNRWRAQVEAYDALAEPHWTRPTGRRDVIGLVEERSAEVAGGYGQVGERPGW